jgi:hypothetical protein
MFEIILVTVCKKRVHKHLLTKYACMHFTSTRPYIVHLWETEAEADNQKGIAQQIGQEAHINLPSKCSIHTTLSHIVAFWVMITSLVG